MSQSKAGRVIAVSLVWLLLLSAGVAIYKHFSEYESRKLAGAYERLQSESETSGFVLAALPEGVSVEEAEQVIEREGRRLAKWTSYSEALRDLQSRGVMVKPLPGSASAEEIESETVRLERTIADLPALKPVKLALDSFSGYFLFRSDAFRQALALEGLRLQIEDDGADYLQRIRKLQSGEVHLALFPIDGLIQTSFQLRDMPAKIVCLVDETTGADAMVAYESAIANVDALNDAAVRIVATRNSPSETLARVLMAHFDLSSLSRSAWIEADGAKDVFERFRRASRTEPHAYVLWEPFVSKILETPGTHVITDSGKFRGFIVDALVVGDRILTSDADLVTRFVRAYLRTRFASMQSREDVAQLVTEDAGRLGQPLDSQQAERLIDTIRWKNTIENYAHMEIISAAQAKGVQPLREIISNLTEVLVNTEAIDRDPTGGNAELFVHDGILRALHQSGFHPGGLGRGETIQGEVPLPRLNSTQIEAIVDVGVVRVAPLVFRRGGATLTPQSRHVLSDLVKKLKSWPGYYVVVKGHTRQVGDPDANRKLALDRARAAADFMITAGIPEERVYAVASEPKETGGAAQSVTFVLGQPPY